jgi:hypothetical protein
MAVNVAVNVHCQIGRQVASPAMRAEEKKLLLHGGENGSSG